MTTAERLSGGLNLGPLLRRILRLAILVAILGGLAYGVWWYFFKDSSAPVASANLTEATVTKGQLVSTVATTGTAKSTLTSNLTFLAGGQVKSISGKVGETVTAGTEIARLDDRDAQKAIQTAKVNLDSAQIRLNQLTEPATAADLASAQQQVASARTSLATAQANLVKATAGPATTDVLNADSAVSSAESALQNAVNGVDTAKNAVTSAVNAEASSRGALLTAQRTYCQSNVITVFACTEADVPLTDTMIRDLQDWIQNPPGGAPATVVTATQNASAFLTANTAYVNAKNAIATAQSGVVQAQKSVDSAQQSLTSAKAKRDALFDPPTATDLAQLQSQVASAQAAVTSAQANLDKVVNGSATANDIALQQQSIKLAQISYQTALDGLDNLVLKAPFDGVIGAIPINVGDQVGASTAAATLSNPSAVRIDLTVTETDLPKFKQGQLGTATFDALTGNTYIVKITAVSNAPTVTQGVTTFAVQAQILGPQDLQANAAGLQQLVSSLSALGGGTAGRPSGTGAAGAPGATGQGGAGAQGGGQRGTGAEGSASPQAGRTPGANGGAGAGGTGSTSGTGQARGFNFAGLANQPMPTPGMNANVTILIDVQADQLLLPTAAIRRQGRQAFVYVKGADGKPVQKNITVAGADATNTGIASGLEEGDKVLVGTVVVPGATSGATPTPRATPAGGVR